MTTKIITDSLPIDQTRPFSPAWAAHLIRSWHIDPIDQWRLDQRRAAFVKPKSDYRHKLAKDAEKMIATRCQNLGYQVHLTTHKSPFDLWVADQDNRAIRVEVKISLYYQCADPTKGGRYQARIHNNVL